MASNRYHGYDQQQDWTSHHQQRDNVQSRQNGTQNGSFYNQENDRLYHDGYTEQARYAEYDGREYAPQQQWEESYQQPQRLPYDTHQQRPHRDLWLKPDRSYQYDERFHNQRQARQPPQPSQHRSEDARRSEDRRRPAQISVEKKAKPRDRILTEPVSPKIAWDSPFPAFNPKKKEDKKEDKKDAEHTHSSLDKDFSKLNTNDSSTTQSRPQISQGQRTREESRPRTAHSQRPPEQLPPPVSQSFEQPPMSPLRKDPPAAKGIKELERRPDWVYGPNGQIYDEDLYNPVIMLAREREQRNRQVRLEAATRPSNEDDAFRRPRLPQVRTASDPTTHLAQMQASATTGPFRSSGAIADYGYDQIGPYDQDYQPSRRQWQNSEGYQNQGSRQVSEPAYRSPIEHSYDVPSFERRVQPTDLRLEINQTGFPDNIHEMPDFESIPTSAHEKDEVHLQANPQHQHMQPAYQKKAYQVPNSHEPQLNLSKVRNAPQQPVANEDPLADFKFELPGRNQSTFPISATHIQPYSNSYIDHIEHEKLVNPQQTHDDRINYPKMWDQQVEQHLQKKGVQPGYNDHYPPRSASRNGPQPRLVNNVQQYGLPSAPAPQKMARNYAEQEGPNYGPQTGPSTGHASSRTELGYGTNHDPDGFQNAGGYGYPQLQGPQEVRGQQLPPFRPQNDQGQSFMQYPTQSGAFYPSSASARQQTSSPMQPRPPPVRHYGERASSDSMARPQQGDFGTNTRSNALPAHPIPVRPGLMDNNQANSTGNPAAASIPSRDAPNQSGPQSSANLKSREQPVTVAELNSLQERVKNEPQDYALALRFAKRLVQAASTLANEGGKADPKTTAKNRERYIFDAHKIVKRLVNAGYAEAMFYLADCHGQGLLGLAPDPKEAFALYQSAAKLNHPQSAYRVAVCCEIGQEEGGGTRRDPVKAVQWYRRAATLGDTPAMYKMGMVLFKGLLGQQKNPREALSWMKRAAERADEDNPHALHELALLYESASPTDHIIRDEKYALQLFQQAADLGYKYSQFRLGSAFEYGLLGLPIDARQSIAWYSRAAAQGEHQSELALSGWYLTGSPPILEQSDTEAYLWARKAAVSGLAKAEYAMGYFTEVGIGASVNIEEAKRWYWKAAAQNFGKARERLEDLKRGGQKMQKTRLSRSAVGKQNEGDCRVM